MHVIPDDDGDDDNDDFEDDSDDHDDDVRGASFLTGCGSATIILGSVTI